MVDYLGVNGAITTTETMVRVGGGGSIGTFGGVALDMTATAATSVQVFGSIWGSTGIRAHNSSNFAIRIFAGGSIAGSIAISAAVRNIVNEGSISGLIECRPYASSTIYNYGSMTNFITSCIIIDSTTSSIFNPGTMSGYVSAVAYRGSGEHRITNSGTISSTLEESGGAEGTIELSGGTLRLDNTGRISADIGAFAVRTADGADRIANRGLIVGNVSLGGGNDLYDGALGTLAGVLNLGAGDDIGIGGAGRDEMNGGADQDRLSGGAGDDILNGGDGNDAIDGGTGADRMAGGGGDDTFVVDSVGDIVIEGTDQGTDTVVTSVRYTLRANQSIEALTASGEDGVTGLALTGNALAQTITGDTGDNRITGGGGVDRLIGLAGDDTYVVADYDTTVIEAANGGMDTILTASGFELPDNVEILRATGSGDISLYGNALDNIIVGNAGANQLDGFAGADRMVGGLGDDTYYVDDIGDVVSDSGGNDTVVATIDYTLGRTVETLYLFTLADINGTGNDLANTIFGNFGANVLSGRGGIDTLTGGDGADTFLFETKATPGSLATITDFAGGTDRIALDDAVFRRIGGAGTLDARYFTEGAPTTRDHHILFDSATGTLSYDADGDRSLFAAVAFATVQSGVTLTASDIFVI